MNACSIQINALNKLKKIFQKDLKELIDWYLTDSQKKLQAIKLAIEKENTKQFLALLKELRSISLDIGAVPFSYLCLNIELALSECRLSAPMKAWHQLNFGHEALKQALLQVQMDTPRVYTQNYSHST